MTTDKKSVEAYTETDVEKKCVLQKGVPEKYLIPTGIFSLSPLMFIFALRHGIISSIIILLTSVFIIIALTPVHEKLHQWAFNRNGYESEIRYFHNPPHVLAEKQHVDPDTWKQMELAPFVGLGSVILFFSIGLTAMLGLNSTDMLAFTLLLLGFHTLGSANDLFLYYRMRRRYNSNATAYIIDTADDDSVKHPFKIYYCRKKPSNDNV